MEIKNNCQIVLEIAQEIKSAAEELQLSSVSCQAGTTQVDMECSQSYENGRTTVADYHIFMEELGENIKEIGVDLEDADKNLLQKIKMEIELMMKEDFHINQKGWQEIEEYENEYRKNVKKQEEVETEIKQLLFLSKSSMEILYQQWGECQEIYKLQEAVQEFEKQAMRECQREEEALEEQYRKLKAMEEEISDFFERNY